jgi:hypothetical protein
MATLSWNGIDLQQPQTLRYDRRVRRDGPTYLWDEHTLHVKALYHPGQTSYTTAGNAAALVAAPGNNPSETDSNIRHQLSQPRGHLVYSTAGNDAAGAPALFLDGLAAPGGSLLVIDCPPSKNAVNPDRTNNPAGQVYLTDCAGGPFLLGSHIRQISMRTWEVELLIRCSINECYNYYSTPTPLLSHRWTMQEDVDREGFGVRRVKGHAIFRMDRLVELSHQNPARTIDDYREALGQFVPTNYQRVAIHTRLHEDGNRIDYHLTDREMSHNILNNNVTWIQARARVIQNVPSIDEAAQAALKAAIGVIMKQPLTVIRSALSVFPRVQFLFAIRVWGHRHSTRALLLDAAKKVLVIKFPAWNGQQGIIGERVEHDFDLMGRFVGLYASFRMGPMATLGDLLGDGLQQKFQELLQDDVGDVATTADRDGRVALANLTRGSSLEKLVAAALGSPCQKPGVAHLDKWPTGDVPIPDPII